MSQLETVLRSILLSPHQNDGDFQLNEIKHALLFEVQSGNKTKISLLLQSFLLEPVIFGRLDAVKEQLVTWIFDLDSNPGLQDIRLRLMVEIAAPARLLSTEIESAIIDSIASQITMGQGNVT